MFELAYHDIAVQHVSQLHHRNPQPEDYYSASSFYLQNDYLSIIHWQFLSLNCSFQTRFIHEYKSSWNKNNSVQKISRMKSYSLRQRGTINETFISFKIISLIFNTIIPASFSLVEAPLKLLFWYRVKLHRRIYFNIFLILKFFPLRGIFHLGNKETYDKLLYFNDTSTFMGYFNIIGN